MGFFHVVAKIIREVKSHMIPYKFGDSSALIGGKLLSSLNAVISTNESTQIITGHVIYNPAYTYKFQLNTTYVMSRDSR